MEKLVWLIAPGAYRYEMQRRIRGNQADEWESTDLPWKRSRERPCFVQLNLWVGCVGAGCCDCNEVVSGLSQNWLPATRACRKVVWWTFLKLPDAPTSVWFEDCSGGVEQHSNKVSRMALFGGAGLEDGFQCEHHGLAYVVSRIQCGWFLASSSGSLAHPPQLKKPFSSTWRRNPALAEYEPQHTPATNDNQETTSGSDKTTTPPQHKNSGPMPNYDPSRLGRLYPSNPLVCNGGFSPVTAGRQTQPPVAPNTK